MLGFRSYVQNLLDEAAKGGIGHIEHPSDRIFDGEEATRHAVSTIRGVANGTTPITRKVDDRVSFQLIKGENGKVGVKYKGSGAQYAYSEADVDKHYGEKPYAGPFKAILAHAGKVLPNRTGEWQAGFLSTPETRQSDGNVISHTPNTINYTVSRRSPEGQKLARSKVSMAIHTELKGPDREPHPILNTSDFNEHPDVHLMSHVVPAEEREILPEERKKAAEHLDRAENLLEEHDHSHTVGHHQTLRRYINSLVESGAPASAKGYSRWLKEYHNKEIAKVKTEKAKATKTSTRNSALDHVKTNAAAFDRTFAIHNHLQQATNLLARSLGQTAHGGYQHTFADSNEETGPEGFVAKEGTGIPLKIVDRSPLGFAAANRARSARFKKPKLEEGVITNIGKRVIKAFKTPDTVKKVQPVEKAASSITRSSTEKTPAAIINVNKPSIEVMKKELNITGSALRPDEIELLHKNYLKNKPVTYPKPIIKPRETPSVNPTGTLAGYESTNSNRKED